MTDSQATDTTEHEDPDSAVAEHRFHSYEGSDIPWYVRALWVGFWVIAVFYVVAYLMPMLQTELTNPP